MKFVIKVKTWAPVGYCGTFERVWKDVRPTHGSRYEFDTKDEADRMLRMCYGAPEHQGKARVVPVEI